MKSLFKFALLLFTSSLLLISCKNGNKKKGDVTTDTKEFKLKEETVTYKVDSLTMNSYLVYDENKQGARPAILVIHEWWGLNDYAKMRARKLAELGYIAMAVDMYGNGQVGNDPASAEKLALPFYMNPALAKKHFDAAYDNFKKNANVDASKMAVIGYCFGGAVAIGVARLGADLKGAVSFHGNLNVVPANKELLKAEILVCHGGADQMVPLSEVDQFKKQMDSIGAKYTVKVYDSATHAFTNTEATATGEKFNIPIRYNATADSASWADMKAFFERIFK